MTVTTTSLTISWLGYATARITAPNSPVVYTDPGRYGVLTGDWPKSTNAATVDHPKIDPYNEQDADIVLVTHDHHYDPDGIHRVANNETEVIVYEAVNAKRIAENGRHVPDPDDLPYNITRVAYGDEFTINGTHISVIPAYNNPDGPWGTTHDGPPVHPYEFGCGYLFTVNDTPCFWPGDSDVIDEHDSLDVSIFLPSIAQSYTMDRFDAADLAEHLDPALVVPIHYNTFPALQANSVAFAKDVAKRGIPVALDEGTTIIRPK